MKMKFSLAAFRVLVLVGSTAWSLPSRADVAPTCDAFDTLITCAAADVGKPCQGGGQCYAVSCNTNMTVYKCDACPTLLIAPDAGCEPSKFGTACGDGGMCSSTQAYCNTSSTKYICAGPTPPKPTGPPVDTGSGGAGGTTTGGSGSGGNTTGTGGSSAVGGNSGGTGVSVCPSCKSNGGCDVAPRATGPGAIALGLLVIGALAFLYDRRRKRRP